jgi:hypothetical protein
LYFYFRHGFPVFVAGTVDSNASFHPTFLALASNEDERCFTDFFKIIADQTQGCPTHIMADGALSITNAARKVFPNSKRLMCWSHMIKNVDKKLRQLNRDTKDQLRNEIQALQMALHVDQFFNGELSFDFNTDYFFSCEFAIGQMGIRI